MRSEAAAAEWWWWRGGAWCWGSGRSSDEERFWTRPENSPEKFSGGGGGGPSGDRKTWERERGIFAMSSNNASSTVTYTSVSSDSNGPSSWGIPLVNAGEIGLDPYEGEPEHPELQYPCTIDDDIQIEISLMLMIASPTAEPPGYIANLDSMEEDTDADSIDYPNEPKDGEEDDYEI
ncbi:hypothetical protein Tco_0206039 [Tanacetum coccineum]